MKKLITLAIMAISLFVAQPAKAAISDCTSQGCFPICTDAGPVEMSFEGTGSHAGTITNVGTGQCRLSADEGYYLITRVGGTTLWIYDVANQSYCDITITTGIYKGLVFGSYAYIGGANGIERVALDCTSSITISTGTTYGSGQLTKDSTNIYILNTVNASVSVVTPPSTNAVTYDIGHIMTDLLTDIHYRNDGGSDKLYISAADGVRTINLPITGPTTTTLWWPLAGDEAKMMAISDTHLAVQGSSHSVYLVPFATPSVFETIGSQFSRDIALSSTTLYTIGGNVPDVGAKAWNMSGVAQSYSPLTTNNSWATAYLAPTVTGPVCPNGTKETGEACDGTQFGTDTCQTFGFDGGSLTCTGTCTIDTSSCFYNCGNGSIDSGEECDGSNLDNTACTDLGFDSGTLSCSGSCEFVTTSCVTATCNNGSIDSGEDCDGSNLSGASCTSLGYDSGDLSCSSTSCTFDTTSCVTDLCGNGTIDLGEGCDTNNFGGESCQSQGFDSGDLSCSGSCTLITSACTNDVPLCGNGLLDNGEQCDDDGTAAGDGCSDTCQIEDDYTCEGEPSDCSPVEETCNQNGLVADSTSGLDFQKLSSHNLDLYNSHLNTETGLTKGHTLTCGTVEVFGNPLEAITVNLASGTYADLAIKIGDKVAQCHFFAEEGAAKIHINANDTKKFFVDGESGSGAICTEDNANVEIQFQGLILAALGTGLSGRKLAIHPLSNLSGNWLEVYVSDATVRLIEMAVSTNNIVVATSDMVNGRPLYLNLDAIGDLTEIFTPPTTTPPKGCGCSTGSNNGTSTLPIAFLSIFILLMIRRRKVFGSR